MVGRGAQPIFFATKHVTTPEDIPIGEHWAIISGSSFTIPGDERSRTNPGHGYPEHTEQVIEYKAFLVESEFREALTSELSKVFPGDRKVRGIHVMGTYTSKIHRAGGAEMTPAAVRELKRLRAEAKTANEVYGRSLKRLSEAEQACDHHYSELLRLQICLKSQGQARPK